MAKQEINIECPFCNKGKIETVHFPSTAKSRKGPYGGARQAYVRVAETTIIITEKCPVCGKSNREIEKALKNDKSSLSHEERIKRMKNAGLPTTIGYGS